MLNMAEEEARKTCQEFGAELIKEHEETCSRVDRNMKHTRQKQQELSNIKRSATNFQTHESLNIFRSFVTEQREELNRLEKGNQLNDIHFFLSNLINIYQLCLIQLNV